MRTLPGQLLASVRAVLLMTVALGLVYPLLVWGVGQAAFPGNANGSLLRSGGQVVGSDLIGQSFTDAQGAPLPQYFQSRPSASDHDGRASGGSNLGPNSEELAVLVEERRRAVAELEGVDPGEVPPDAVTASASGLDPGISPEYAAIQVQRVARERGIPVPDVQALVAAATSGRDLGVVGAPHVDVLALNLSLDREFR